MNTGIIATYVAIKMAHIDPLYAEARRKMERSNYVDMVLGRPASDFPTSALQQCQATITRKYGIAKHNKIFRKPTVAQYIADITGTYSVDDILDFFHQETGLNIKDLASATIGGQIMTRPALIWSVEKLEAATGKQLGIPDSDAPLSYLGDKVTLREIAQYFSTSSEQATRLRRLYARHMKSSTDSALRRFRPMVLESYRICAEVPKTVSDHELLNSRVLSWVPNGCGSSDWDLPLFWLEEELNLNLPSPSKWVTESTTVQDLVDVATTQKLLQLRNRHRKVS